VIWVAFVFAAAILAQWWRDRQQLTVGVIVVGSVLLTMTLAFSAIVTWHLWPEIQPLRAVELVFEPPTRWLYSVL
jgi:uncharacterized membrane protein YhhN